MSDNAARFLAAKAFRFVVVLLVILTVNFALPRVLPGDPTYNLLGERATYNPTYLAELRERMGLGGPLHEQYGRYLVGLTQGDLGYSFTFTRPVSDVLGQRLGWTLLLVGPSVLLGALLALVFGTLAGWRRSSWLDVSLTSLSVFAHSMPHYWVAMLAVMVFAYRLSWFPLGRVATSDSAGFAYLGDLMWHLALPLAVLTLFKASYDCIIVRNTVVGVSGEDHVLVAQSRGVGGLPLLLNHVVRNSLAPLVTVTALQIGNVFAGALLVEIVFSWPGMGTVIYDAVAGRDYPLLQASFLLIAVCVIVANFLADVAYAWLDPRVQ